MAKNGNESKIQTMEVVTANEKKKKLSHKPKHIFETYTQKTKTKLLKPNITVKRERETEN